MKDLKITSPTSPSLAQTKSKEIKSRREGTFKRQLVSLKRSLDMHLRAMAWTKAWQFQLTRARTCQQ